MDSAEGATLGANVVATPVESVSLTGRGAWVTLDVGLAVGTECFPVSSVGSRIMVEVGDSVGEAVGKFVLASQGGTGTSLLAVSLFLLPTTAVNIMPNAMQNIEMLT